MAIIKIVFKMKKTIILIFLLSLNIIYAQEKYDIIIPTKYVECEIENKNTIIGYTTSRYDERSGDFNQIWRLANSFHIRQHYF
jgi:hypothetical protein